MEREKIEQAVDEAARSATLSIKGENFKKMIASHADENGKINASDMMFIAMDYASAYSKELVIETLSRLL